MAEQKGKGYQELEQLKYLSTKMQEVTSNVRITKKMKSNIYVGVLYTYVYTRDPRGIFR